MDIREIRYDSMHLESIFANVLIQFLKRIIAFTTVTSRVRLEYRKVSHWDTESNIFQNGTVIHIIRNGTP